jgi:hypothetical protein
MGVLFPWGPPGEALLQLPRALFMSCRIPFWDHTPSVFHFNQTNCNLREMFEKGLGEGYVLDSATNSPLEVDREGDFYINVGIEENQEGFKESEGDQEGNPLEVVDAWLRSLLAGLN